MRSRKAESGEMMNPVEDIMPYHGEIYSIRRAGDVVGIAKGLRDEKKELISFLLGTDVKIGDELENDLTKKQHVVSEVELATFMGKLCSVDASYGQKQNHSKQGHTFHIGSAVGSPIMVDSPNASQSVTFTGSQTADLRKVLAQLLQEVDGLEIEAEAKAELKQDTEYLKKKLDAGKAKPGFVRECLNDIRSQLATAASKLVASGVTSKVSKYGQMVQDFYAAHFGNV